MSNLGCDCGHNMVMKPFSTEKGIIYNLLATRYVCNTYSEYHDEFHVCDMVLGCIEDFKGELTFKRLKRHINMHANVSSNLPVKFLPGIGSNSQYWICSNDDYFPIPSYMAEFINPEYLNLRNNGTIPCQRK